MYFSNIAVLERSWGWQLIHLGISISASVPISRFSTLWAISSAFWSPSNNFTRTARNGKKEETFFVISLLIYPNPRNPRSPSWDVVLWLLSSDTYEPASSWKQQFRRETVKKKATHHPKHTKKLKCNWRPALIFMGWWVDGLMGWWVIAFL